MQDYEDYEYDDEESKSEVRTSAVRLQRLHEKDCFDESIDFMSEEANLSSRPLYRNNQLMPELIRGSTMKSFMISHAMESGVQRVRSISVLSKL